MAAKKAGRTVVWIIMGLLVLGLGGFGVTNFSGQITSVGSVGTKDLDVDVYARSLQEELRAIEAQTGQRMSFEQAEQLGLVEATLAKLISARAMDHEAAEMGISVGDHVLIRQLQQIQAFQGIDGNFDREAYEFALERNGLSKTEFETRLREETARTILQAAVVTGDSMAPAFADALMGYIGETRKITWARIDQGDLDAPLPAPTQQQLQDHYEAHIDRYTIPEKKLITYAWLSPDMLIDTIEVDEDVLMSAYKERDAEFNRPARRLVERLVYPDQDSADTARAQLDIGATDFETLVSDRGLELSDIDLGDVTRIELGAAGEQVFAAKSGDVVGPLMTDLGPALFRINGIFPAVSVSFDDARTILTEELVTDQARRAIDRQREEIEDLLAGGATLEDLANETDMELGTIGWFQDLGEGIAAYDGFDEAAAALQQGAYPEIAELEDGGIFAMRMEGTEPPAPSPLADVKSRVLGSWENQETLKQLRAKAEVIKTRLQESATFASLGLEPQIEEALNRNGSVLGTPQDFVTRAFAMSTGDIVITESFGAVQIMRLDAINAPSDDDENTARLRAGLAQAAGQSLGQDLFRAVSDDIRARAGVTLDQNALNAVHANFR
ncbi:MAG: peptidyl-prolyl cis-trans isomerase [Pseudooceanicola sp.]